jgi:hypothetical protein
MAIAGRFDATRSRCQVQGAAHATAVVLERFGWTMQPVGSAARRAGFRGTVVAVAASLSRGTTLRAACSPALCLVAILGLQACQRRGTELQLAELVGDPLGAWRQAPAEAYARNIWDLQVFQGRIYLGYGDAIVNTGPTEVIAYDPARRSFDHDTVLQEEAILEYRVFGDRLFVPGADAVRTDDGTLYIRDSARWTRIPLPKVAHALDVAVRGAEICVVVQDRAVGGAVRCTPDEGASWHSYPSASWRSVSLFELGGVLHVSSYESGVRRLDGSAVAFALPGVTAAGDELVTHATACGDAVAFIAARIRYVGDTVDRQILGLFRASLDPAGPAGAIAVARIDVPGTPSDVFVHAGRCYAVTNRPRGQAFDVEIGELTQDGGWRTRGQLAAAAMARSGELLDDHFYVGLGCDPGHCSAATGRILRIRAAP